MTSTRLFFVLALIHINGITNASDNSNPQLKIPVPLSPNTAAIEKFGSYSVNHFSGLPDISIPIYTIKSRSLSLPITLRYHASGIKVTDVASWVGLGWSLNAGGQITRNVMGTADDQSGGILSSDIRMASSINPVSDESWLGSLARKEFDQEADVYSYTIPGNSGNFIYLKQNGVYKPVLVPFDDVKIDGRFVIYDASGTKYSFNATESTYNSTVGTPSGLMNVITAWKLTSITESNGNDQINLDYYSGYGETYYDWLDNCSVTDGPSNPWPVEVNYSYTYQSIYTDERNPKKITFPGGFVEFRLNGTNREDKTWDKSLKSIVVYAYRGPNTTTDTVRIRSIDFQYSYFNPAGTAHEKRLKLDAIKIRDASGLVVENYSFEYNTAVNLPAKTSRSRDYWGYFNNAPNTDLIPNQQIEVYSGSGTTTMWIGHADRLPNENYMKANILNKIVYPTGGFTEFFYEANKYEESPGVIKTGGGLRIQKISSKTDASALPVVKTYKYGYNESGWGVLNAKIHLSCYNSETDYRKYFLVTGDCFERRTRSYLTASTLDMAPWDGSPVFYPYVTEYEGDASNNIGKTIFRFTDFIDSWEAAATGAVRRVSYHWKRGLLLEKKMYRKGGSNYALVGKTVNTYFKYASEFHLAGLINQLVVDFTDCAAYGAYYPPIRFYSYTNYDFFTGDNLLVSSTEYTYDNLDTTKYLSVQTQYDYNNKTDLQLLKVETTDSNNDIQKEIHTYPMPSTSAVQDTMICRHLINKVIKTESYNNSLMSRKILYEYILSNNDVLISAIKDYPAGGVGLTTYNYPRYDSFGNIQEELLGVTNIYTTYLWSYNNTLPVAKVINASYSSVASAVSNLGASFIANLGNAMTQSTIDANLASLRTEITNDLPRAHLTTYTYKTLEGVSSTTDAAGIKSIFEYDNFGRLKFSKDYNSNILVSNKYNYGSYINTIPEQITVPALAGSHTAIVQSNASWTASDNATWITVNSTSGSGSENLLFSCAQNTSTSPRSGQITITGGGANKNFSVTQQGASATPSLTVSPSYLFYGSGNPTTQYLTVSSNISWTISVMYYNGTSWLQVSPVSGSGNASIAVTRTYAPPAGQTWNAEINISGSGISRIVTITSSN